MSAKSSSPGLADHILSPGSGRWSDSGFPETGKHIIARQSAIPLIGGDKMPSSS